MTGQRLRDLFHASCRKRHLSESTERVYWHWILSFLRFHELQHPLSLGSNEVEHFLSHLAVQQSVAPSTQTQALCSIVFLYRSVLHHDIGDFSSFTRAKPSKHLPVVLSRQEVRSLLDNLEGVFRLQASLLYGAGLRLTECMTLRVKDIDFDRNTLFVRQGKGAKDRSAVLPDAIKTSLHQHVLDLSERHKRDVAHGVHVPLPGALARKYPNANRSLAWYWLFPSAEVHRSEQGGERWHQSPATLQRAVSTAIKKSGNLEACGMPHSAP